MFDGHVAKQVVRDACMPRYGADPLTKQVSYRADPAKERVRTSWKSYNPPEKPGLQAGTRCIDSVLFSPLVAGQGEQKVYACKHQVRTGNRACTVSRSGGHASCAK